MSNSNTYNSGYAHPSTRYWISLIVKEIEVNKSNNTSKVSFDLRARSEVTWDLQFSGRLGYIEVNGERIAESYTNLSAYDGDGGAYDKRICSATKVYKHKDDGTLSLSVKGYYDYSNILISQKWWLSSVTTSGTFKCTTISTKPTLTVSIKSQNVESVSINWKSDINVSEARLYDNSGNLLKSETVSSKKTGSLTASGLLANTSYTFKVKVKSTSGAWSSAKSISAKTTSTASASSTADLVFGNSLPITKTNTSGLTDDLYFYVNNTLITTKFGIPNSYTLTFTQNELDTMYKLLGKNNTATTLVKIVSKGSTQEYVSQKSGTLTLTGIAKTAHVGVNNKPKRAMVWIGINKNPKRAVCWIGASNTPRRTI